MAGLAPVELTTDCDACGLEGGVVEVYDALVPACRFGLPASARCTLCDSTREGRFDRPAARPLEGVPANRCPGCLHELTPSAVDERRCGACGATAALVATRPRAALSTLAELEAALDAWAERAAFPSREALAGATFVDPDTASLLDRLRHGQRIEILADPFANMGVRTAGRSSEAKVEARDARSTPRTTEPVAAPSPAAKPASPPATPAEERPLTRPLARPLAASAPLPEAGPHVDVRTPPAALAHDLPRSAPPRAIVYPLVSVVVADGEIHPEERALVDRFLQSEGLPPLSDEEFCVHHPSAVAHFVPRERREEVVKLMCESASIDGMPDESERRVIRAYAIAWGVDDEKLDFWMWGYEEMHTSLTRALWLKLRRFVLSARWGDTEPRE